MASEILGLFGGQNSQQLRNNALDSMMISPSQMGSQGLLQQVVSMGQNAGTMAGMGAGRLMGGKVAGEVEASYLEQAIQAGAAGKTPAEKMKLVAASLEDKPGMGAQYMKALSEARRLEAEDFTMASAKEKGRTREVNRQFETTDPLTQKITSRTGKVTQVDTGRKDEKGNIVWEDLEGSGAPPPAAEGAKTTGNPYEDEALRRARLKQNPASSAPAPASEMPQARSLPPQGNTQLSEADRLQQLYYEQQQAANPRPAPAQAPTRPALPPLVFKSVEDQENAMRRAVAVGNRELAMRIRDATIGTNR